MIETKIIVKPKGNSGTGNSSGAFGYGGEYVPEADYAARAGKAKKAESADLAMRANTANTADRAKYADKAGELDEEAEVLQRYIRKDIDDIAQGTVTWEKVQKLLSGLLVGNFNNENGGSWTPDTEGRSHLITDYLEVRMKAIFEELVIKKTSTIGGKEIISPAGGVVAHKVENVTVTYNEVSQKAYRCYFLAEQEGDSVDNDFSVNDQVRSESFNVRKGTYHKVGNHFYWRLVIGRDEEPVELEGKKYHYIDLSDTDCATASDIPANGDVLNQCGNRTDVERQNCLIFSAVDTYSPSISLYHGINSYSFANKEYVEYGVNKQTNKAFFNVYGDMYVGDRPTKENGYEGSSYIKYDSATKQVSVKGKISAKSTVDGKELSQYIKENSAKGLTEEQVNNLIKNSQVITDLQNQVDGAIETWFYEGVPTLKNAPASSWTSDKDKDTHLGDLYYDNKTGKAYRFAKDGNTYKWTIITDTDISKALSDASKAQETADGKMKVFSTQPTPPYQVGDIWVNATYPSDGSTYKNEVLRCQTLKAAGSPFAIADWIKASKYTDDTVANAAKKAAEEAQKAAQTAQTNITNLGKTVTNNKKSFDNYVTDGYLEPSEIAAMAQDSKRLEDDFAAAQKSYNEVKEAEVLTDTKELTDLKTAFAKLTTAKTELVTYLSDISARYNKADTNGKATIVSAVGTKFTNFQSAYASFYDKLGLANAYITSKIYGDLGVVIGDVTSLAYLKKALMDAPDTEINGGLVLTSLIGLRDTDGNTTAGINGITEKSAKGGGIAAWFGGEMVDKDYNDGSKTPANTIFRFDGSGYVAGGAIWWGTDGRVHADPTSFIISEKNLGAYLTFFEPTWKAGSAGTSVADLVSLKPNAPFTKLGVSGDATFEGAISFHGIKLTYDATNKAIKIDGNLYATGGITAYGAASSGAGGGGLNASVISYARIIEGSYTDADLTSIPNAYAVKALSSRIDNIATELGGLNLSWNNITDKPTTFTPSAHNHKWIDITDRITKVSQLTNDKNFVTGSVSGQTITINGVSTTWQNTWRGITDSYSGTSTGTSLSQKGANSLYNALHNGYASSAGNSDTVDGYHASGLLTALSNSNNGISITVGGTTKSISNISVNHASNADTATTSSMVKTANWDGGLYVPSDTHYMCLGYMNCTDSCDCLTLLVTSAFWGNQHGSQDIITIQQSTNARDTARIQTTVGRLRLGGSHERSFYYYKDDSSFRLYLYVYVRGGNSYGRWNISYLGGNATWVTDHQKNVTKSSSWIGIEYTAQVNSASKVYGQVEGAGSHELVRCDMDTDQFRIIAGSNGHDNGWAEIAIADNGNEPIYVRQYSGVFSSVVRTLTLLDANGHTHFPSYINIGGNENNNSSPDRVWGSNGSDSYLRSYRTSALSVANADTVDGVHMDWSTDYTAGNYLAIWDNSGTVIRPIPLGSVSIGNADKLDGYHESSFLRYRGDYEDASVTKDGVGVYGWAHTNTGHNNFHESYGDIINIQGFSTWRTRFDIGTSGRIRIVHGINTTTATQVGYLAYLHDNVASATKLQTPRTIWGQSFDGTNNVDGTLTITNSGSDDPHIISTVATWFHIVSKYKLVLYAGDYNSTQRDAINILSNHNVGIGVDPYYKLHVAGDIYSSSTIRTATQNKAIVLSNDSSPAWISALNGRVIFNIGKDIRFGETDWDWNKWAGLKYTHSNKTIYLGIADGSAFYANNPQSNGTLKFPGITTIIPDSGARIGGSDGSLFLGNANNKGWVYTQDICSQTNSSLWSIKQDGNAYFKNIYSDSATINGDLSVNGLISNKGILPTNYEVNNKGPACYVSADALCSGITAITDSIQVNQVTVQYSNDNGNSWTNYPMSNDAKFNLYANNAGLNQVYLGYNVITGNNDAEKLAQVKKNELIVSFYISNNCYAQPYFASVDISNGIYTICTVDILNNSGAVVETYTKRMTGWNQINYINLSYGNTAEGVGNDSRRYIRFRFKHDQNTTTLRNVIINKIRIFSFTKYSFPTDRFMGHTGHIYNFDYNMNTYFPNSILAKGGVTAYQSSDIRLKTNIAKLNCLNVIKSIGGTYEFDYIRDHKHSIGFIAQNVNNPLLKDIVAKDDNGYLKINYWNPKLISLAFGALTEIDDEVDKLKARVRELESEVEYLKNKAYALQ